MHDDTMAILKGLVPVAWADGRYADEEKELIEGLIQAFGADAQQAEQLRAWACEPKSVDDVPITDLSYDDRRVLLQHAVYLSYADGDFSEPEKKVIDALVKKLRISDEEAQQLMTTASDRAKRYMNLL
jgi:tellurite resistance protein